MSHTTKGKLAITNIELFKDILTEKGIKHEMGSATLFMNDTYSGLIIHIDGWRYPVVLDSDTNLLTYDNYNGKWGLPQELQEAIGEYEKEQLAETLLKKNKWLNRRTLMQHMESIYDPKLKKAVVYLDIEELEEESNEKLVIGRN